MGQAVAAGKQGKQRAGRWLRVAGTVVSSALFAWLLLRQDWAQTWQHLQRLPAWYWPACLALVVCGMVCNAWRWHILLRAQRIAMPFWDVLKTVVAGAFASNFLPSTIGGDAFRIISLLRFAPSRSLSVATVVVDRAMNVLAYLSLMPFALAAFGSPANLLNQITAGLVFFGKRPIQFMRKYRDRLAEIFSAWLRTPGSLAGALAVSWVSILVVIAAVWLIALGLGIGVAFYQVIGVSAITYLVTLLPVSVNGYGLREVTVTTLYISLGATLEQASTLALVTRFFMLLETLPGALWLSEILPSAAREGAANIPQE